MKYHYKVNQKMVKQLLEEGHTYRYIGASVGCSYERVRQYAKRWNLFPHRVRKARRAKVEYQQQVNKQLRIGDRENTPKQLYIAQRKKFSGKKANSFRYGHKWDIKFGEIVWPTHCPILGIPLDYFATSMQENSVSFDRIDPSKGYIPGNTVVVSWRANRIKNDGTAEEHDKIAKYLAALDLSRVSSV